LAFRLGTLGVAFSLAQESLLSVAFAAQRAMAAQMIRIVAQLAEILVVTGGLLLGFGIPSLGAGMAVGGLTGAALSGGYIVWLWRRLRLPRPTHDRDTMSEMLHLAPLTFVGRLAGVILGRAEPTIVSALIGPGSAAILSLTSRAYQVGQSLVNPIAGALLPGMAHYVGEHGREKARPLLGDVFQLWALLTAMIIPVVFALNRTFVALWVGPEKYAGHLVNALLLASSLVVGRVNLLGIVVGAFGRIAETTWNGLRELAVRFALMMGLLFAMGIAGAPLATLVSVTLVSGVYLSRLIARDVDPNGNSGWAIQASGAGLLAVCVAIGVAGLILIPQASHWLGFCTRGAVLGATLLAVALVWGKLTRRSPIALLRSLRGTRPASAAASASSAGEA
jgi:O-antigen/teichoic acid export membrane protein